MKLYYRKKIPQVTKANTFTNAAVSFDEMQAFVICSLFKKDSVKPKASNFKVIPALEMVETLVSERMITVCQTTSFVRKVLRLI
jgi:hypothetical protein